jgi:hypothetical protein|tara:strand:- start:1338 stop:1535 length:198 start_codon:yes stop_codon:yes gene_type:complete
VKPFSGLGGPIGYAGQPLYVNQAFIGDCPAAQIDDDVRPAGERLAVAPAEDVQRLIYRGRLIVAF